MHPFTCYVLARISPSPVVPQQVLHSATSDADQFSAHDFTEGWIVRVTILREPPDPIVPKAWILLSGGIDSSACVAFYLQQGFQVECFHLSFGQAASAPEHAAAERVARHYGCRLRSCAGLAQRGS